MSNTAENIYAALRRQIMAGSFAPGAQLKEEHLAQGMGVSRTPVRAALRRLVSDGLLRAERNRGVFVAEWTSRDVEEIFELRLLLESHAAGLAALRATPDQIQKLHALTDRMAAGCHPNFRDNLLAIQEANHQFHTLIIEAAGSARLKGMAIKLAGMPMVVGTFYFYTDLDMVRSIQHHRDLTMAIETRDRELARQIMGVHIWVTHRIFMKNSETKGPFSSPGVQRTTPAG
jgi:DNA-binding GntR family transcriptional regulator